MRRARHSRSSGREQALDELFAPAGLEADPAARGVDSHVSLRPCAAGSGGDGVVALSAGPVWESATETAIAPITSLRRLGLVVC